MDTLEGITTCEKCGYAEAMSEYDYGFQVFCVQCQRCGEIYVTDDDVDFEAIGENEEDAKGKISLGSIEGITTCEKCGYAEASSEYDNGFQVFCVQCERCGAVYVTDDDVDFEAIGENEEDATLIDKSFLCSWDDVGITILSGNHFHSE